MSGYVGRKKVPTGKLSALRDEIIRLSLNIIPKLVNIDDF